MSAILDRLKTSSPDSIFEFREWKLGVKEKADELSCKYSTAPIPVLDIANSKVTVEFADFGIHSNRVSGFCDFAHDKIYVNMADGVRRQSFTIAHELGHWILHRQKFEADPNTYQVLYRSSYGGQDDQLEKEANHFAAHLLVPDNLLKPLLKARATVFDLAEIFAVSRTMMEIRMKNVSR